MGSPTRTLRGIHSPFAPIRRAAARLQDRDHQSGQLGRTQFARFPDNHKLPAGHLQHGWKPIRSVFVDKLSVLAVESVEHVRQEFTLELNDVLRPVNEAELDIERIAFSQVAAGRMWFGPIHVTGRRKVARIAP